MFHHHETSEYPGRVIDRRPRSLPRGTVTFVLTDIEGSTRVLQRLDSDYDALIARR